MSAKTDQTTSYMRVACTDKKFIGINSCYDCHDKQYCEAYTLIMDLTAERNMCPLNPVMEKCVVDQVYLPHVLVPHKQSENVSDEPNRYEKVSCIPEQTEGRIIVDFHDTITTEEAEEYLDSLPRTKKKPNDEVNSKLW